MAKGTRLAKARQVVYTVDEAAEAVRPWYERTEEQKQACWENWALYVLSGLEANLERWLYKYVGRAELASLQAATSNAMESVRRKQLRRML